MTFATAVLAHLTAAVLVVVAPVLGVRGYRLLLDPDLPDSRRRALLRRGAVVKWVLVVPVVVVFAGAGAGWGEMRLWGDPEAPPYGALLILASVVGTVVLAARLRSEGQRRRVMKAVGKIAALLPRSRADRRVMAFAMVTAGVTEEILYRAFLIAYVAWLLRVEWAVAAVVAGALFGAVHVYQGWKGVVATGLLGIAFGLVYREVGLVTLMVVHTLIDLRLLLFPVDPDPSASRRP